MLLTRTLLGQNEPLPEEVDIPGTVDSNAVAAATEKARRQRIMLVGGLSLLGVVIVATMGLVYVTREPRSKLDRHPLRVGQHRRIAHVKYHVHRYGMTRIGTC